MKDQTIDALGLCVVWTLKGAATATLGLLLSLPGIATRCGGHYPEPAFLASPEDTRPTPGPAPSTYPENPNFHSL